MITNALNETLFIDSSPHSSFHVVEFINTCRSQACSISKGKDNQTRTNLEIEKKEFNFYRK